ncbi:MAG TPA: hypothetical protein K8V25_05805 [Megamonas hypermegale]|uniref:hypothetical protein n=1 Tax=Megamonas hypermegale TaxID=158847 RepID=UPI0012DC36CE|nr:hypothetical protein [Megamonas hypermegale]HJG07752.1 hypothetical protein [Megamonas hypermegale]
MSTLFLVLAVVITWIAWFTGKYFWRKKRFFLASFVFLFWIIAIAIISVCRQQYL